MPVAPPAAGRWRLMSNGTPPLISNVTVTHTGAYGGAMETTFGTCAWDEEGGIFHLGSIGVLCLGSGTFKAVWSGVEYTGTCLYLGA